MENHQNICYLDSAATAQKPAVVIDAVEQYMRHEVATIHRWMYDLAMEGEDRYRALKQRIARHVGGKPSGVVFTQHTTGASNLLVRALEETYAWPAGSTILLAITEHHASIVPWQRAAKKHNRTLEYIDLDEQRDISLADIQTKRTKDVRAVVCSAVSNVTGKIHSVDKIGTRLRQCDPSPLFIVDASQAAPHMRPQSDARQCDALYFTGHKMWALTGIGVLWLRDHLAQELVSPETGWGAVVHVTPTKTVLQWAPDKFEPGTPNMVAVISLAAALDFLEPLWETGELQRHEHVLMQQFLEETKELRHTGKIRLIGWTEEEDLASRVGVISWTMPEEYNPFALGQFLAQQGIAMRVGAHCAQPLHLQYWRNASCRISFWASTTQQDVTRVVDALQQFFYWNSGEDLTK